MAEVESIAVSVNLPTDVSHIQKEIENIAETTTPKTTDNTEATEPNADTGTSPTQERSSNSHPHDSEYDTATDLEGAEDYDDEENSVTEDEDYDDSDEEHQKLLEGDEESSNAEKADGETPKKVDEDRRNPQYIPKRGTFYEHDDREDEVAADAKTTKVITTPASQPPKARKWQVIPSGDRWSHDRFDASEQAPKSAAELVSSYGYDIRNEEAPPRARRRRRYAKGPTRYQRNWEDENAYTRNNTNKERRPPRPADFPALDERAPKGRKSVNSRLQRSGKNEEPENQIETISIDSDRPSEGWSSASHKAHNKFSGGHANEKRTTGNSGRHQTPMQFKSKQRRNQTEHNNRNNNEQFERQGQGHHQQQQQQQQHNSNAGNSNAMDAHKYSNNVQQLHNKPAMQNYGNENTAFNNSSNNAVLVDPVYRVQTSTTSAQQQLLRQAPQQQKTGPTGSTSNLQQRLQQVQNRNDPSHVGSVQMHTLATQNQIQANQQQAAAAGMLLQQQQQQQQQPTNQQLEQRGPPKRYSSIRRTQHDAHLTDHQLQQLQQQKQQQQQQAMMLPPEQQHMLAQANLMQHLYHQEKLQAQMQALQVSQPPPATTGVAKPNTYATVPGAPPATAQGYAPNNAAAANVPAAAYYVATAPPPEAASYPPPEAASYPPPAAQAANYLPPAPYGPATAPAGPPANAYTPPNGTNVNPSAAAAAAVVAGQPTSSANPNFGNYQNYNTVGGTTYFVPPPQPTARQVVLPQRRPTNAIPILPPDSSERAKQQQQQRAGMDNKDEMNVAAIDSAENIDHIIDNMFVQRPVFQPPRKSSSPPVGDQSDVTPLSSQAEESMIISAEKQTELNINVVEQQDNTTTEKPVQEQ